jgi:AICAR transformylase/IMP cyclohydrolase PurH
MLVNVWASNTLISQPPDFARSHLHIKEQVIMPRALFSVYNKTDLSTFASTLVELGWDLVATGGTEAALRRAGLNVTPVEQVTGAPEMLGGRVKTLHPAIHAGILVRDRAEDMEELARAGYAPIKMVVCNLYPFQETVAQKGVTLKTPSSRSTLAALPCCARQPRTSSTWS